MPAAPSPVSRHGCTPAYPSAGRSCSSSSTAASSAPALRKDAALEQIHWSTNRRTAATGPRCGSSPSTTGCSSRRWRAPRPEKIGAFKELCLQAALAGARTAAPATASSATTGSAARALHAAAGHGAVDRPAGGMAGLAPADAGARDRAGFRRAVGMAAGACGQGAVLLPPRRRRRDAGRTGGDGDAACSRPRAATGWSSCWRSSPRRSGRSTTTPPARVIQRFYDIGIYPDWWKLEPFDDRRRLGQRLRRDRRATTPTPAASWCSASMRRPRPSWPRASRWPRGMPLVKGFAVGRTIFAEAARDWLAGAIDDAAAVADDGRDATHGSAQSGTRRGRRRR